MHASTWSTRQAEKSARAAVIFKKGEEQSERARGEQGVIKTYRDREAIMSANYAVIIPSRTDQEKQPES